MLTLTLKSTPIVAEISGSNVSLANLNSMFSMLDRVSKYFKNPFNIKKTLRTKINI